MDSNYTELTGKWVRYKKDMKKYVIPLIQQLYGTKDENTIDISDINRLNYQISKGDIFIYYYTSSDGITAPFIAMYLDGKNIEKIESIGGNKLEEWMLNPIEVELESQLIDPLSPIDKYNANANMDLIDNIRNLYKIKKKLEFGFEPSKEDYELIFRKKNYLSDNQRGLEEYIFNELENRKTINDKEIVKEFYFDRKDILRFASSELTSSKEFMFELIKMDAESICFMPYEFSNSKEFINEAVKVNGLILPFVNQIYIDYNLVLEAVKQNGFAYKYAGDFKTDPTISLEAVKQNNMVVSLLPEDLQTSPEVLDIISDNPTALMSVTSDNKKIDGIIKLMKIEEKTGIPQKENMIRLVSIDDKDEKVISM